MRKVLFILALSAGSIAQGRDLAVTISTGMNEMLTSVSAEVDIGGANDLGVGVGIGAKTLEAKIGLIRTMTLAKNIYGKGRLNFGGGRYNAANNDEFTYGVGEVSLGLKSQIYERIFVEFGALQRAVINKNFDRTPSAYLSGAISF